MILHVGQAVVGATNAENLAEAMDSDHEAVPDPNAMVPEEEQPDLSDIFRYESWYSKNEMRVEVADRIYRTIMGDETVEVDDYYLHARGALNVIRGQRERTVGSYHRSVDNDDLLLIGERVTETVAGEANVQAHFSAEAIVGGAYVNTITGAYLRLAAWVDFLVWGGWLEADVIRAELAACMIRSHFAYVHVATIRATMASRLIDDFQLRDEKFATYNRVGTTYTYAGAPGSGQENEA